MLEESYYASQEYKDKVKLSKMAHLSKIQYINQ